MATRKSTRILSFTNDDPVSKDDNHLDDVGGHSAEEVPKKKTTSIGRKRGAEGPVKHPPAKRRRGNQGLLKAIVNMPLDIVFEIFGKLSPADLLNLSQTSKGLRNILLSRSSAPVWKEARKNIPGLPDCPPDLSEPQYADLCFTKHCTTCLRSRIASTYYIWSARVRLCKSCIEEECISGHPYASSGLTIKMMPSVYVTRPGRGRARYYFHLPSIRKWDTKLTSTVNGDERAIVEQELKVVHEHSEACSAWFSQRQREIVDQQQSDISEMGDLVVEHAKKLGWTDEFMLSPGAAEILKRDENVHKACTKNVTERDVRVDRLASAVNALLRKRLPLLKEVVQQCLKTLPLGQVAPNTRQLFEIPSVRDLVLKTPDTVEMNIAHFQPVVDNFVALIAELRARTDKSLIDLIKESYGPDRTMDEGDILHLATTVFVCSGCSRDIALIGYPRALSHACNTRRWYVGKDATVLTPLEQAEDEFLLNTLSEAAWNRSGRLDFRPELSTMLGDIIELCGFKRDTTTRAEMDATNPVFECLACHSGIRGRVVMTWWTTIRHWYDKHALDYRFGRAPHEFRKMTLRVIEDAKEAELLVRELAVQREKHAAHTVASVCAQCHIEDTSYKLKTHWKEMHGRIAVDGDILPKIDCDFQETHYTWPPRDDDEHKTIPAIEINGPSKSTKSKDGSK